ncbi:hypothetical protein [Mariniflexile maritimum]|jgi:predicted RNA-binding Zn-ribbon protein involved in translation (DUF1610 family)|uniref:hypothetical protein n=1 Tax=Mariniflexile maritimum TaxID=2682493 RepID=UPI0012F63612|nr:hypothetical protein [Mariniflexile maritimum]MCB0451035.1 hypothetical protein [Confluentibacter sp.]HMQ43820.1 hypothetical protein [Mariniflexile sp.]HMR16442.1 hypothetical protein [Mariniflexile sp.]
MKTFKISLCCLSASLLIVACSKEDNEKDNNEDCTTCSIPINETERASYQLCQNGNDVIYTSGNIRDTIFNTVVADVVLLDKFHLGAICDKKYE